MYAFSSVEKDNLAAWIPYSPKSVESYLQKLILITQPSVKCLTTLKALLFWDLTKLMNVCRQEMKPKCQVCPVSCHSSRAWFHINYLVFSHQCWRRVTERLFQQEQWHDVTSKGINVGLFFTQEVICPGHEEIIFLADRNTIRSPFTTVYWHSQNGRALVRGVMLLVRIIRTL